MDVFEALRKRKMTRAFTTQAVNSDDLDRVIAAAYRGPSAGNTRSLEMLILRGDEVDAYWETTLSGERRAAFPWPQLLHAPVLMIPTVAPADYVERYGEPDKAHTGLGVAPASWQVPYWWVDGGAALENVLLAAEALELGACFFGQFEHEPTVAARFGIPDGRRAIGTVALGHPASEQDRPSRSAQRPAIPAEDRSHWGHWDS